MSYYCKGEDCKRQKKCARNQEWLRYPNKDIEQGFATGVWFVDTTDCIANDYYLGVWASK